MGTKVYHHMDKTEEIERWLTEVNNLVSSLLFRLASCCDSSCSCGDGLSGEGTEISL
jgi:hypothetical protein